MSAVLEQGRAAALPADRSTSGTDAAEEWRIHVIGVWLLAAGRSGNRGEAR